MTRTILAFALLASTMTLAQETPSVQLHALFETAWEKDLQDNPRAASYLGDKRFNASWADLTSQALAQRDTQYRNWIAAADRIDPNALSPEDQLNRELFKRLYQDRLDQYRFKAHLRAVD